MAIFCMDQPDCNPRRALGSGSESNVRHLELHCLFRLDTCLRLLNNLTTPSATRQNHASTASPRSIRKGTCLAASGSLGISRKYAALPARTATKVWRKFFTDLSC